jgi:hypothetical protein
VVDEREKKTDTCDFIIFFQVCNMILDGLFIGTSLFAKNREALRKKDITHIVAVVDSNVVQGRINPTPFSDSISYHVVVLDDEESQNLLEEVQDTNRFIKNALDNGGRVLVQWYMKAGVPGSTHSLTHCVCFAVPMPFLAPLLWYWHF